MQHTPRRLLLFITFSTLLWVTTQSAHAFFYEWDGEKIIKVMDLPNTDDFRDNDGNYVDVGVKYKQFKILFIPLWNYDKRFCGYIGQDDFYLDLAKKEIEELAADADLELPAHPQLPLWDAVGGKLVLALLIGSWILLRSSSETKEKQQLNAAPATETSSQEHPSTPVQAPAVQSTQRAPNQNFFCYIASEVKGPFEASKLIGMRGL